MNEPAYIKYVPLTGIPPLRNPPTATQCVRREYDAEKINPPLQKSNPVYEFLQDCWNWAKERFDDMLPR